jgi:type I restriction enzyme S subunit
MNNYQLTIKSYPVYKDSGVEWLETLPNDWEVKRLKEVLAEVVYGTSEKTKEFGKYEVLGMGDIDEGKVNYPKKRFIDNVPKELLLKKEDLLFNRTNSLALVGKVGLIEEKLEDITFASYLIRLRLAKKQCSKYFWYLLNSEYFISYSRSNAIQTANQANLSSSKLKQFKILYIAIDLQKLIANYLDTKTAQIDRKIDLLTQKAIQYGKLKQSLINETVTRGLDKSMPMKDSGIEWIGDVPEHWKVKRVKDVFTISRGRVIAQTELIENGHYPVYSSQTKDDGCLGYINTFDYEGDYITWTTDGVNAGTIFLRQGRFNCTNICGTLKLNEKNHFIGYLFYALQVSAKHNKRIDTNGAKIMSNEMMFIKISIPPLSEQKAIADYLDIKTAQIDQIIQTINTQIEKLKELRKTLINDVVTGKIKVIDN